MNAVSERLSILVVDDEFDLAELLSELLTDRGHQVTTAINGLLGMSLLMSNEFDLVISDFMMPVMDGIDMVKTMRTEDRLANLPVIMMSARAEAVVGCVEAGLVQALLSKPFLPKLLFTTMDRVLDHQPAN